MFKVKAEKKQVKLLSKGSGRRATVAKAKPEKRSQSSVKKAKVVKTVKVKGKKVKRVWTRATLAGSLTENGQPITGVTVTVAVNKKPVKSVSELRESVAKNGKGSPMLFRVQRQDASLFLTVTV